LVEIPSVTGDEAAIADYVEAWATRCPHLGASKVERVGNALLVGTAQRARPCVALVGHLDTVPPPLPYAGVRIEGDRLYGRGACDMKGGLAVMQLLAETLPADALPFDVLWVFYDAEEGPYEDDGLRPLLAAKPRLREVQCAFVLEPTSNTLQLGCLGTLHAEVTFTGRAAHSARPWQGENAIHKAGPMLQELARSVPNDVTVGGLVFRETVSATVAHGGGARNVVPDRMTLNLNHRFAPEPGIAQDAAVAKAKARVQAVAAGAQCRIVDVAPPGPVPSDNPILSHFRRVAPVAVEPKQAWTDVALLAEAGIAACNFGPGDPALAHQADEFISMNAMVDTYDILRRVLTTAPMSD
jgi:succinyl-diaminopimelate desuccinylase